MRLIAVGAFHNLALQEEGTLWAWGNNEYGQLGTGDTQPRSQPIRVNGLSGLTLVCTFVLKSFFFFYLPALFPLGINSYHHGCSFQFHLNVWLLKFYEFVISDFL